MYIKINLVYKKLFIVYSHRYDVGVNNYNIMGIFFKLNLIVRKVFIHFGMYFFMFYNLFEYNILFKKDVQKGIPFCM